MRFEGVWTRRLIWIDPDMSHTEKTLLAEIESLDKLPLGCFASNKYFAEFFQLSRRQIRRYITRLAARGWIQVVLTGRNRRRLRPTAKLKALRDGVDATEGRKRPSAEGQKCPPISTKKNSTNRSHKTQDFARASRCELGRCPTVDREAIPAELILRKQWVVWRWEKRNGKLTKPPYQPNGSRAKVQRSLDLGFFRGSNRSVRKWAVQRRRVCLNCRRSICDGRSRSLSRFRRKHRSLGSRDCRPPSQLHGDTHRRARVSE